MSTAVAIAHDMSREKIDLIKQTVAKGSTDLELELFLHACKRTGLDPLMKQIYAIKRKNHKTQREEMSIQTGIDGYRLIADRTGQYAGSDEPVYDMGADGFPDKASVTIYKMVAGQRCPFSSSARWTEYVQESSPMWKKMPFLMLAKCAEALALRKAFPAELSGVYTHEEMMQAENEAKVIGEIAPPTRKPSDIMKESEQSKQEIGECPGVKPPIHEAYVVPNAFAMDAPPAPSFIWKIGKEHKDESIATIPDAYLDWFVQNGKREDHVEAANIELDRRRGQGSLT